MKYFKVGFIIFGICSFLYLSTSAYYRNYARFYNGDFTSLVIWKYFPLAFFCALRGWLTFSIIDFALKMKISKFDKNKYILFAAIVPLMLSLFIEDRNYDAILYNGWRGLIFYPTFLSNLFLMILYLLLKNKAKESGKNMDSVEIRSNLSIMP